MPQSPNFPLSDVIPRRAALACSTAILTVALAMPALGQSTPKVAWDKDDGVWNLADENWLQENGPRRKFENGDLVYFRQNDGKLRTITVARPNTTTNVQPDNFYVEKGVKIRLTGDGLVGNDDHLEIRNHGELGIDNEITAFKNGSTIGEIELTGDGITILRGKLIGETTASDPTIRNNMDGGLIAIASSTIQGVFENNSRFVANGARFVGTVTNTADDCAGVVACAEFTDAVVSGQLRNEGSAVVKGTAVDGSGSTIGALENNGKMALSGVTVNSPIVNKNGENDADLTLSGRIVGSVLNSSQARLNLDGSTVSGSITSQGQINVLKSSTAAILTVVSGGHIAAASQGLVFTVGQRATLDGEFGGNGNSMTIRSSVGSASPSILLRNGARIRDDLTLIGEVETSLNSGNVIDKDLRVQGALNNTGTLDLQDGEVSVANTDGTKGTLTNDASGSLRSNTRLSANVISRGRAFLSGAVDGNVTSIGPGSQLTLGGALGNGVAQTAVTGNVASSGRFDLEGDAQVSGRLSITGGTADLSGYKLTANGLTNLATTTVGAVDTATGITNSGILTTTRRVNGDITNEGTTARLTTRDVVNGNIVLTGRDNLIGAEVTGRVDLTAGNNSTSFTGDVRLGTQAGFTGAALTVGSGATATVGSTLDASTRLVSDVSLSGAAVVHGTLDGDVTGIASSHLNVATTGRIEGDISTNGSAQLAGTVTGRVDLGKGGKFDTTGANAQVGTLKNAGQANVAAGSALQTNDLVNDGTLVVRGDLTVLNNGEGQGLTNNAALTSSGKINGNLQNTAGAIATLSNQVGAVDNRGTVRVNAGTSLGVGGTIVNRNAADLTIGGRLTGVFSGAIIINHAGGNLTLGAGSAIEGSVHNAGTTQLNGDSRISSNFTNTGTLNNSGASDAVDFTVKGQFSNTGLISADNGNAINIIAGKVTNNGTISGTVFFDGELENYQDLRLNGGSLGGNVNNRPTGSLSIAGTVNANGHEIDNSGSMSIARGAVLQDVAFVTNRKTLTSGGTIDGNFTNTVTGTASLTAGSVTGNVVNDGTLRIADNYVIGRSQPGNGRFENRASATGLGKTQISGLRVGQVVNSGDLSLKDLTGNVLTSAGNLTLAGTTTGSVGVTGGVLRKSGTVTGNVSSSAQALLTGKIGGDLAVRGGRTTATGNLGVAGQVNVTGGHLVVPGSGTAGQERILSASNATLSGPNAYGTVATAGRLAATSITVNNGATLTSAGTLAGRVNIGAGATLRSTGVISGPLTTGGNAYVSGQAGAITVAATGQLTVRAPLKATTLTNEGRVDQTGTLTSTTVSNLATGTYALGGRLVGSLVNAGQLSASDGAAVSGDITNSRQLDAAGALAARRIVNTTTGTVRLAGRLTGSLDTAGDATVLGGVTGSLIYRGGTLRFSETSNRMARAAAAPIDLGRAFILTGGTVDIAAAEHIIADRTTVQGPASLNVAGRLDSNVTTAGKFNLTGSVRGDVTNSNQMAMANASRVTGLLTNTGTVTASGRIAVGGLASNGGVVDIQNESTEDQFVVGAGGIQGGRFLMDAGSTDGTNTGDIDRISSEGAITGALSFDFKVNGSVGVGQIGERTQIVTANAPASRNTFTISSVTGLPTVSEQLIYGVQRDDAGNVFMITDVNSAAGALAGNVTLTQSLIGSVVNRPTSPLVGGLATGVEENPCGAGAWGRFIGGRAEATGGTRNNTGTYDSKITANYRGIQVGGDFACFGGHYSGWDMAFGALGGINDGTTEQPVYAADITNPGELSKDISSMTRADFRQVYGGLYLTATKDRVIADLQVRRERTDFDIVNRPVPGSPTQGLLLDDDFSSNATTVSGSLSYIVPMTSPNWSFTPTAGFALTNTNTDQINFKNGAKLKIEDARSRVAFVGASISRTQVAADDRSAYTGFATGTFYKDFSENTASEFTTSIEGETQAPERLVSDNLGAYGEISVGVNYVRILEQRGKSAPRQFNASVRLDGRTGDTLDSVGVTGQMRFQF